MRTNGAALREIIARSPGVSVPTLAASLHRSHSTIYDVINDRRPASDDLILEIADALKVPLPAILADPDEPVVAAVEEALAGVERRLDDLERRLRRVESRLDAAARSDREAVLT